MPIFEAISQIQIINIDCEFGEKKNYSKRENK